jgi:hypothetical protein
MDHEVHENGRVERRLAGGARELPGSRPERTHQLIGLPQQVDASLPARIA